MQVNKGPFEVTSANRDVSPLFGHRPPQAEDAAIWTERRQQLLKWFQREAPSLAAPYEGAVRLLYMNGFPGQLHIVCHIIRDIYQLLPEVLDPTIKRVQPTHIYPGLLSELNKHWPKSLFTTDPGESSNSPLRDSIPVPRLACQAVEDVLQAHVRVREQASSEENLAKVLFRLHPSHSAAAPARLIEAFKVERRWFTDRAHLSKKAISADGLTEHFEQFEAAFFSFVGEYFSGTRELNDILLEANKRAD